MEVEDKMRIKKFSDIQESINLCFEGKNHQAEVLVSLYNLIIPKDEWSKLEKVNGYPEINPEVNQYIFKKFIAFDREHHPNVINGGLWMNNGFSSLNKDVPEDQIWLDEKILQFN